MPLFKALVTVVYKVSDMSSAVTGYKKLLQVNPNFEMPFYTGFTIGGGFELGLMPLNDANNNNNMVIGYWEVGEDINEAFNSLVKEGATVIRPVQEVGEGIYTAELQDPFGNPIGIIHNPLFIRKYKQFKFSDSTEFSKCFLSLETLTLHVDSPENTAAWYEKVLGLAPSFVDPTNYIGFTINGFSLGIMPKRKEVQYDHLVTCYWRTEEELSSKITQLIECSDQTHSLVGQIKKVGSNASLMEMKDHTGIVYGVINDRHFHFELALLSNSPCPSIIQKNIEKPGENDDLKSVNLKTP